MQITILAVFLAFVLTATGIAAAMLTNTSVGPADRAVIDIVLYDETGLPIFATSEERAKALYDLTGAPSLVGKTRPSFEQVNVEPRTSDRPADLTRIFGDELRGRSEGETFRTSVHENPYGEWNETLEFTRVIGPFPRTHTVDRTSFDNAFPTARPGENIVLTAYAIGNATLLARTYENATYRVEIGEGDILPLVTLGFTARAISVTENEFSLEYEADVGHEFNIRGTCGPPFYTLGVGSYRVVSLNQTQITLRKSDAPYPQLVGKNVYAEVTIHKIQKLAALRQLPPPIHLLWSDTA